MCARTAGLRGRRVVVLEGANKVGKKILMSGGGRCNFTNVHCEPSRFISANPHFCKSALSRYTPQDFIDLVEKHGIAYHEKALGQLFCDHSSKDILAMLETECAEAKVEIRTDVEIKAVNKNEHFEVSTSGATFTAESLVLATGGLSIPKMGATDIGYQLARQFDMKVLETRAGLVPLTFTGAMQELTERLTGLSIPATVSNADSSHSFTEAILFTHRGLSGPVALQISSYWQPGEDIYLNLLPECVAEDVLLKVKTQQPKALLRTVLTEHLPRALVLELQALWWPDRAETRCGDWPDAALRDVAEHLNNWVITPAATEGYRTAEVTLGGIDTDELSSQTMESKQQPGLYCIGEVLDVTGHLGGFNFQWAWSSAVAAGEAV